MATFVFAFAFAFVTRVLVDLLEVTVLLPHLLLLLVEGFGFFLPLEVLLAAGVVDLERFVVLEIGVAADGAIVGQLIEGSSEVFDTAEQ